MIHHLYSLRDSRARVFGPLLQVRSLADVERQIVHQMGKSPDSSISKYPADFVLYRIGSFDDITGKSMVIDPPERVIVADEIAAALNDPMERDMLEKGGAK